MCAQGWEINIIYMYIYFKYTTVVFNFYWINDFFFVIRVNVKHVLSKKTRKGCFLFVVFPSTNTL